MNEYCQHMNFYFIIFFIFQIGMRPNQLPYKVNYMDFHTTHVYNSIENNQPSTKVYYTVKASNIDIQRL